MLPGWQKLLQPHVESGALTVIGVVQEQHPARAKLYRQWRELDWPILVDALNLLDHKVVPIPMAIDPSGVVRAERLEASGLDVFLRTKYEAVALEKPPLPHARPGDAAFLDGDVAAAVAKYRAHVDAHPDDARAWFRLGVALRRRFESDAREPGDGQAAVDAWAQALALDPSQYIWRRRLQQYGPTLAKPYNFYGWVEEARTAIRARGDTPVPLPVEPRGAELLGRPPGIPAKFGVEADPADDAPRDETPFVSVETIVTPPRARPGDFVRVRVEFRPRAATWNDEGRPLKLVAPGGRPYLHAPGGDAAAPRVLDFEVQLDGAAPPGPLRLAGYAVYDICEKATGTCRFLRRDLEFSVVVDPKAVKLGR